MSTSNFGVGEANIGVSDCNTGGRPNMWPDSNFGVADSILWVRPMLIKGTSDSTYGVGTSAFGVRPDFFSISIDISVLALQRNIIHKICNIQSNSLSSLILKTSDIKHLNLTLTTNLDFNLTTQRDLVWLQKEVATS